MFNDYQAAIAECERLTNRLARFERIAKLHHDHIARKEMVRVSRRLTVAQRRVETMRQTK